MFSVACTVLGMNQDLFVLRAMARLSRRGKAIDCESLSIHGGGSLDDVRAALGRLSRAALVDRSGTRGVRLTLAGLALAVASRAPAGSRARVSGAPRAVRRRAA
jgi:RIO-like serine/threonine protein kinase